MNDLISFNENGIYVVIEITEDMDVRLLHFSCLPFNGASHKDSEQRKRCRLVEVQASGENQDDHHGSKHTRTNPGVLLKYISHRDYRNEFGRKLEIELQKDGLVVTCHMQFYDGISVVRLWTVIKNVSYNSKGIEYVSPFALSGIWRISTCEILVTCKTWKL